MRPKGKGRGHTNTFLPERLLSVCQDKIESNKIVGVTTRNKSVASESAGPVTGHIVWY